MRRHTTSTHLALAVLLTATAFLAAGAAWAAPQAPAVKPAAARTAAASGIDPLLKDVSTWNGGIESAAVWKLRAYVYARKDDPAGRAECEPKLLAFLKSTATPPAKLVAARHLRIIAGDSAVPALQALLADERLSDLALYVLQPMPGPAADKALLQAMATAAGATKVSIIAALGERRYADAVPALTPLLKQPAFAAPAATALGAIGGDAAAQALAASLAVAAPDLKRTIASAMLRSAEKALAAKNDAAALAAYEALFTDTSLPTATRTAAALGKIAASGSGASSQLAAFLNGTDPLLQRAAISKVQAVVPPDAIGPVCARLAALPEAAKVQLLAVLATYPSARVLPAVTEAARSESAPVRLAALKALESVGDESSLAFLLETAAGARGTEQAAARSAIGLLRGAAVNDRLLAMLAAKPGEGLATELLFAVADRRVYPAKPLVAAALASDSAKVRLQALRSLRAIGTPSDVPAILDIVVRTEDEVERFEAQTTVGAIALAVSRPEARSAFVKARLATEKNLGARVRLIGVLPLTADPSALPVLRRALSDAAPEVRDAAVRALTAWPTTAAQDDVFRLARDSRNETHRLLAIRALVTSITLDRHREPASAVADLRTAAGFAWRPEEQKLVLGALVQFPCREAIDLANSFLGEPAVKAEAEAALGKMTQKTR
jgi:HEAT repeat protein